MKKFMHFLSKLFPNTKTGENPFAVNIFYRMNVLKDFFRGFTQKKISHWPVSNGNYQVLNAQGQIAVCTLTSENMLDSALISKKVAIIGTLITPNLGLEKIILNIISNQNIRYLVVCGKDSPIFRAGQAIECLFKYGFDKEKRIVNALGHFPVLKNLSIDKIQHFIKQVQFINLKDEKEPEIILNYINTITCNPSPQDKVQLLFDKETFTEIKTWGRRIPLDYDKYGFFVISIEKQEIVVRHYNKDNSPGFIIRGKLSERILLAILNKNLVSQMSHAGYLGAELMKAEIALKLGLKYKQDIPLNRS